MSEMNIHMVDLVGQYEKIKREIDTSVLEVLSSGQYILGKSVESFEKSVSQYLGVKHAIGCASGTDALQVALMAIDVKPGDEIITTPFTFVATVETIVLLGAKPVYVDIEPDTFNIDPNKIENAITKKTRAILPVHLYGHSAEMTPIMSIASKYNLPVIEDSAQAMGAEYRGKKVGTIGTLGCISFFPSKNLGAYGDAGMIVTNDDSLADRMRMIIIHGSRKRYYHEILGVNSRLDAMQAAILQVKLKYLDQWNDARRMAARKYIQLFEGSSIGLPVEKTYARHIYHQYTIRVKNRNEVERKLTEKKIPHAIYYPIPLHLQEAFREVVTPIGSFPITERAAEEVISLPMHTELIEEQQECIVNAVLR